MFRGSLLKPLPHGNNKKTKKKNDITYRIARILILYLPSLFHHPQDFDGASLLDFHVSYPNQPTLQYQLKLGDETFQAPMGVFYPQLFGVVGEKMVHIQQRNQGDPEDIHDELYLLQTQSQQQQVSGKLSSHVSLCLIYSLYKPSSIFKH